MSVVLATLMLVAPGLTFWLMVVLRGASQGDSPLGSVQASRTPKDGGVRLVALGSVAGSVGCALIAQRVRSAFVERDDVVHDERARV